MDWLVRTWTGRVLILLILYAGTYAALRIGKVLVHRSYFCSLDEGTYWVEDVGRGPFSDDHNSSVNGRVDRALRVVFFPLVEAEGRYWGGRVLLASREW